MRASLKTLTSTQRGDVEETSHRAQSLLLRNLNKVPDRWFREAIWKELDEDMLPRCAKRVKTNMATAVRIQGGDFYKEQNGRLCAGFKPALGGRPGGWL